jgi:hypothetical protein
VLIEMTCERKLHRPRFLLGLNESARKRDSITMYLNNRLPPPPPCKNLSVRTRFWPLLPPAVSLPRRLVDSNRRAVHTPLDVVGHRLPDPDPVRQS